MCGLFFRVAYSSKIRFFRGVAVKPHEGLQSQAYKGSILRCSRFYCGSKILYDALKDVVLGCYGIEPCC